MRSSNRMLPLFTCALLSAIVVGCGDSNESMKPTPETLEGIPWALRELDGTEIVTAPDARPVTLTLDSEAGNASGFSGVNQFHGSYKLDGNVISFGPMISTRRAGPPEQMEVETAFLNALSTDVTFAVSNGELSLSRDGAVVARFTPLAE